MADADKQASEEAIKKELAREQFITDWPLYTPFDFVEYEPPKRISYHCTGPKCSKERTWELAYKKYERSFTFVQYQCTFCGAKHLSIWYRSLKSLPRKVVGSAGEETHYYSAQIQKVGQFPPLSVNVPNALEKNLGRTHTALYKKALVSRNEGFGLGAVSYIRRVVEDKTEELIEVVAQLAEAHQIDTEIIKQVRAAKTERTTYDQKLKIAATVLPKSLVIDGVNPLDVLYSLVSAGLHDLTEEQCIEIADETKSVFEYTFTRLRAEISERKEFAEKVKKWAGGKLPTAKKPTG
jgi:hypothetical protein